MAEDKIEKIYDVSLIGVDDVLKGMDEVNASFDKAKSTFLSFKDIVKTTQSSTRAEFEKSRVELLKQQTAQKNLRAETIAYNNVLNAQKLAAKQAADGAKVVAGSYEDLRLRAKALREQLKGNLVIEGLDSKKVAEGTAELKKLVAQMQQFDRSLSKDGTLVAEYTSGINKSFSALRANLSQLVLGFIGFQAVIGGLKSAFDQTVQLDSLNKSMEVVSNSTNELSINQKFLIETSELLGIQLLESGVAFKNFYAASTQAGISAEETRRIFFAAASASANLKLSQENTNGVLLAFGQIASKGKVQAEELRGQIGERIPGAFAIAARAIGVTQVQLNKMLENGEVIASEFLPKFAAELQKTFGTTEKVEGLQASINRLKNTFTELVDENGDVIIFFFTSFVNLTRVLMGTLGVVRTVLKDVFGFFKSFGSTGEEAFNKVATAESKLSENIAKERTELDLLFNKLRATNGVSGERSRLIDEINAKYGTHLTNLSSEKEFITQLNTAYAGLIQSIKEKLLLDAISEDLTASIQRQIAAEAKLTENIALQAKAREDLNKANENAQGDVNPTQLLNLQREGLKLSADVTKEMKVQQDLLNRGAKIQLDATATAGGNVETTAQKNARIKAEKQALKDENDRIAEHIRIRKGQQKEAQDIQKEQDDFQIKVLQDAEAHRSKELKELEIFFLKQRNIILNNTALTDKQRKAQLAALADAEKRTLLSAEVALLTEEVNEKEKLYRRDAKNEAAYLEAQKKLLDKSNELAALKPTKGEKKFIIPGGGSTQSIIGKKISDTFGTEGQTGEDVLLGEIIAQSFNIANQAMNNYFDAEAARIERSKQDKLSQLETEREIALSRATTQAQEDRINKDFQDKKREAEKEAFDRMKDLKKKEAAITYATELINIAAAAAASGPYAPIQYAILAGLASVRYGIQLNNINAQQFKRGGQVPLEGGEFIGPSHDGGGIHFSGAQFEAEGKEVAIINKKASQSNARYTVTGTPKQIASSINSIGGGAKFAPGASMFKLANGGYLGSSLQPPVFASYYQNSTAGFISGGDNTEIKGMMKELITAVYRESFKPVVLNPGAVTEYQNDTARKVKIGQL